jgi:exodeoxyribonuclease VII large subunit
LLVPDRIELLAALHAHHQRLHASLRRRYDTYAQRTDNAWLKLHALRPQVRLERGAARLSNLRHRLALQLRTPFVRRGERLSELAARMRLRHPQAALQRALAEIKTSALNLSNSYINAIEQRRLHLTGLARALSAVSPLATLERGYVILLDPISGRVLRTTVDTSPGQRVDARMADGILPLRVLE